MIINAAQEGKRKLDSNASSATFSSCVIWGYFFNPHFHRCKVG